MRAVLWFGLAFSLMGFSAKAQQYSPMDVHILIDQAEASGISTTSAEVKGQCIPGMDCSIGTSFSNGSSLPEQQLHPNKIQITAFNNGVGRIDFWTEEGYRFAFFLQPGSTANGVTQAQLIAVATRPPTTNFGGAMPFGVLDGDCLATNNEVICTANVDTPGSVEHVNIEFKDN
jgi:hypothetical protein